MFFLSLCLFLFLVVCLFADRFVRARGRVFSLRAEEKQRQGFLGSAKQLFMSALESFETALSGCSNSLFHCFNFR